MKRSNVKDSYKAQKLQGQNKRCKPLKWINFNGLLHNTTLMNINFEISHY